MGKKTKEELKSEGKVWDYKSSDNDKLAKQVKKDPDIVYTKPEMAKMLLKHVDFKDGDLVMEPTAGKNAFYDNFPDNVKKIRCEINDGIDYFDFDGMVDLTISNPPFVPRKFFWKIHQKAMETTKREIRWLINMASLNVLTPKRLDEMKEKGWFFERLVITQDKRWFGRYCFVKFGRKDKGIFKWSKENF